MNNFTINTRSHVETSGKMFELILQFNTPAVHAGGDIVIGQLEFEVNHYKCFIATRSWANEDQIIMAIDGKNIFIAGNSYKDNVSYIGSCTFIND